MPMEPTRADVLSPLHTATPSPLPFLNGHSKSKPSSLFSGPAAFFGPTCFSAVYQEYKDNLDEGPPPQPILVDQDPNMTLDIVNLGAKALAQIPDELTCRTVFSRHVNPNDGWIRLAGPKLSGSIFQAFGTQLRSKRPQDLRSI